MAFQGLRRGLVSMNAVDPMLANLLHEEKDVLKGLANFAKEKGEASKFLALWGNVEHADIKDICDRVRDMFDELQNMLVDLSTGYSIYRDKLKDINKGGEDLHALQQKLRGCQDKLAHAIKNKKPHDHLQVEVGVVEKDVLEHIAECESSKRALLKEGLETQFDAFQRFGKQLVILGTFGKHMTSQIPQGKLAAGQELPLYKGNETTKRVFSDFLKEIGDARSKRPLIRRNSTLGSIPEIARKLSLAPLSATTLEPVAHSQVDNTILRTSPLPPPPTRTPSAQALTQPSDRGDGVGKAQMAHASNIIPYSDQHQLHLQQQQQQQQQYPRFQEGAQHLYQPNTFSPVPQAGVYQASPPHRHQSWVESQLPGPISGDYLYGQPSLEASSGNMSQSLPSQHMSYFPRSNEMGEMDNGNGYSAIAPISGHVRGFSQSNENQGAIRISGGSFSHSTPVIPSSLSNLPYEPASISIFRCGGCGHGVAANKMGDHRASGCLTHIISR
ncbi:hypothetical protein BASA50_006695 [Batrachochytrium salamandrivorans]|uniref:Uncharacterized protein n=1 Tax=Batrachochytrium salamandrivorans TaxID=1357716 RepID=A0ABQ8F9F1_9FUNG|nr:hypothetical protein BASA62_001295 [Batrachochytrium salamandrivorans]KAH6579419.1 hypothetical protein BASA60_003269 [Batrachochytrium salamandrivorans]KAH6594448.1 hypothetical protein BASA50_006695 [Batrachochytrium salamandrivorans]KAH6594968.1 hypothetical protein BASA61_003904 [Batrachochytrium salamandrivorans]KAH6602867.1 hypothetical protein BASA61_000687 [Batrachochytrium salamandrivorans]